MSSLVMRIETDCDHDLIPEWRCKYVDYNAGKRHIKAIARAAQQLNSNVRPVMRVGNFKRSEKIKRCSSGVTSSTNDRMSHFPTIDFNDRKQTSKSSNAHNELTPDENDVETSHNSNITNVYLNGSIITSNKDENKTNHKSVNLLCPLDATSNSREKTFLQEKSPSINSVSRDFPVKLHYNDFSSDQRKHTGKNLHNDLQRMAPKDIPSVTVSRVETASSIYSGNNLPTPKEPNNFFKLQLRAPISSMSSLSNVFSNGGQISITDTHKTNNGITASEIVILRQNDFVKWFEQEIEKVETFYKRKEDEAAVFLGKLDEQLLEMRIRRVEELAEARNGRGSLKSCADRFSDTLKSSKKQGSTQLISIELLRQTMFPIRKLAEDFRTRISCSFIGQNNMAFEKKKASHAARAPKIVIDNTPLSKTEKLDDLARPFQYADQVPYGKAKRKLKLALFECFRSMNLLKSYTILNQLAFRKLIKKYNQAVGTNAPTVNISGNVNHAWFVKSDELDRNLSTAVGLYARYFESGNQTIALVKLRRSIAPLNYESTISFRDGVFLATGIFFCFQGYLKGIKLIGSSDPLIRSQSLSIMELYAGYFLCLYLFAFFCFDCFIWTRNHINYQFVMEFDIGHTWDWRILASIPSLLLCFLGLCMNINFSISEYSKIYVYIPLILIAATAALIFLPAPILFHRGRRWFIYSNWRLLLSGLYPVEFRDFFLADIYCSLTYVMSNLHLFFCLYLDHWRDPEKCGSQTTRLLGIFGGLPSIWRVLQCLRRYYDTRDIYPHLLNGVKYLISIVYLVCLSVYRINNTHTVQVLFILVAIVNTCVCSLWDVFMDWSLMQPSAKDFLLRDVRGFRKSWWYYGVMILNPILRFVWILYTANLSALGHSSKISFFMAFAEVTRRGIWTIFRVENAHCSNVTDFKASHDLQLPYTTSVVPVGPAMDTEASVNPNHLKTLSPSTALGSQISSETTVQRRPLARILSDAHTQDYEKRRQWWRDGISYRGRGGKSNDIDSEGESSSDNDDELDDNYDQIV